MIMILIIISCRVNFQASLHTFLVLNHRVDNFEQLVERVLIAGIVDEQVRVEPVLTIRCRFSFLRIFVFYHTAQGVLHLACTTIQGRIEEEKRVIMRKQINHFQLDIVGFFLSIFRIVDHPIRFQVDCGPVLRIKLIVYQAIDQLRFAHIARSDDANTQRFTLFRLFSLIHIPPLITHFLPSFVRVVYILMQN